MIKHRGINLHPHTYYVSAAGNDANSGTPDLPLLTLAAVNALVLKPGDRVLFNRGDVWSNQVLTMGYSGTPSRHIKFGAYGTGANPVIDGSITYPTWTADTGAIYYVACTLADDNRRALFENGVRLIRKATYATLAVGSFFLDDPNNKLYVWCAADADPNGRTMKFTSQQNCVYVVGKSYIDFDSIDVTMADMCGYNLRNTGSSYVSVSNATSSWVTQRNFDAGGLSKVGGGGSRVTWRDHITFTDCVAHDSVGEGFWLGMGNDCGCLRCTSYNNCLDTDTKGYSALASAGGGFTVACDCIDFFLRHCTAYNCAGGTAIVSIEFVVAEGDQPQRTVIDSCSFYRDANILLLIDEGTNSIISNNIFNVSTGAMYLIRLGMSVNAPATNELYYHNTINTSVATAAQFVYAYYGTGNTFKNNIFSCTGGAGYAYMVTTNCQTGFTSDYNELDSCGSSKWGSSWYTLANWRTNTGQDNNSIANAPVFVTANSNFHLQVTSPCRNAGATNLGVLQDYDQVPRTEPPDIGCYEYSA
jgi:hypothetical protein